MSNGQAAENSHRRHFQTAEGKFLMRGQLHFGGRGNGMSKKFPVEGFAPWVNYPKVAKVALKGRRKV
jgi:hypothetical protein